METSAGVARKTPATPSAPTASGVQGIRVWARAGDPGPHVLAVLHQHGFDARVMVQYLDEFDAAVAAESDNTDLLLHWLNIHSTE